MVRRPVVRTAAASSVWKRAKIGVVKTGQREEVGAGFGRERPLHRELGIYGNSARRGNVSGRLDNLRTQ